MRSRTKRVLVAVAGVATVLGLVSIANAATKTSLASPTITSAPSAATTSRSATFAFTGPSGATFKCGLDGAATVVCTSPRTYTALTDGAHVFKVVSVKSAEESAATSFGWTVDTVAPASPTITSGPDALASSTSASFAYSGPEAYLSYRCSLDGAAFGTCSSPTSYSGLGQGAHTFAVRAVDAAGNTGPSTSRTWRVDTVAPPAPVLTTKPPNPTSTATNDFAWTSAEAGTTSDCSLENGAWFPCTSPYRWVINTTNSGQHQFAVRSRDAAGNASAATQYTFKYENGLPSSGVPFQITGSVSALQIGVWQSIGVRVSNPNSVAIYVSALQVSAAPDSTPAGCTTAQNLELEQSNVSTTNTLIVPANGSVVLPAQGATAPRIRLRNLPTVNQDVCKNKSFALSYTGTATN
jgi:hypothetical protein